MPEGDTIFRAARTLHRALRGERLTRFESVLPKLNRIDEDAPLAGRTVEEVSALGKHLLMRFSGELTLRTHMRMSGSWHIYRHGEAWHRARSHMRILLETAAWVVVGFDVPIADFFSAEALVREDSLRLLGPDTLSPNFDLVEAQKRLRARGNLPVGEALLKQRVVAGIGNVFKSEILFLGKVAPTVPVSALPDAKLKELLSTAERLLKSNVKDGKGDGIVTFTGMRRTTGRSDPSERLWVYGRSNEPCRICGTRIAFDKLGLEARVTYWCPQCQV